MNSSGSQEDPFVRKQVAKVQWALRALSSRVWLLTRQLRRFFRWAEMMDVVICRPFFRCKHHYHDFVETCIWTVLIWMELFEIFQYKGKNHSLSNWWVPSPMLSHIKGVSGGRVAAVFAWFVIYFSEDLAMGWKSHIAGVGCWITRFSDATEEVVPSKVAKQRTDATHFWHGDTSPLAWAGHAGTCCVFSWTDTW